MNEQKKTVYLCIFCAVPLEKKIVFGKEVYQCPKCKRKVKPEDLPPAIEE